jgi:hypothetical protein
MKKRITPPAPQDVVLRIGDQTWQELEKNLGRSLEKWARDEITVAADQFAVAQYFRIVDKARRQLRGSRSDPTSISRLRTHLARVLEEWSNIQNDTTAKRLFEDISDELGLGDIAYTMGALQSVNHHLDSYLSSEYDPFPRYVKGISLVCERVTRGPMGIAIPTGYHENETTSTFVMFMMTLDAALPDYAQKKAPEEEAPEKEELEKEAPEKESPSPAAWAQALYRARKV